MGLQKKKELPPMKSIRKGVVLAISALPLLCADVTISLKTEMKSPMPVAMPVHTPHEIYMKGNKGAEADGDQITIMDFSKQEITIVDKAHRKYATIPASEFEGKMAAAMPRMNFGDPQPAGSTKNKVESRKTGRMETILGVQTEESESTFSMEMPLPAGPHAPALTMNSLTMKIVTQEWNALPAETMRVPAIYQLVGFNLWQDYFMSDAVSIKKLFPQSDPSFADAFKRKGTTLRSSTKMYMSMPGLDASAASSGTPVLGAPFMEMNYEIVDLSTAPVDDVFFQIPAGYGATTFAELMNGMTQGRLQAEKEQGGKPSPKPIAGDVQVHVPDLVPTDSK
jgi:hypothetical protein